MKASNIAKKLVDRVGFIKVSQKDAPEVVNAIFDIIAESLQNGEEVGIRNFGSFKLKKENPRTIKTPTGKMSKLKNINKIYFKPAKKLKEKVNGGFNGN